MAKLTIPNPPAPLNAKEQNIKLIKGRPPRPAALYLLFATLTSLGGLIMGWVYLIKDGAKNKSFGILSLLLGLVLPAVIILALFLNQESQKGLQAPLPEQPGIRLPK